MKKYLKMICIVMVVIVLATSLTIPVFASSGYTDVPTSDSCYNAVIYLRDHNIMVGQTSTYFGKNETLIRADVVTILWRMLNKPEPDGSTFSFPDCDSSGYYYKAVQWACSSNVGIASGYENGNFGPTDLVSNQDLLTFLYRFACYCGYASNSSSNQNIYLNKFNQSNLIYKNSFWEYSKVPVGWAYSAGFITKNYIQGTIAAIRGDTAEYTYYFYQYFQKKRGLVVVNTEVDDLEKNIIYAQKCRNGVSSLLKNYNVTVFSYSDITKNGFENAMELAFQNSKRLDLCYIYLLCHGADTRIALFSDGNYLAPSELRELIEIYSGTFITFINSCHAGIFISSPYGIDGGYSEEFDIDSFVRELVGSDDTNGDGMSIMYTSYENLSGSNRIKVLGACYWDEVSYQADRNATYYWCEGSGYDLNAGNISSKPADVNKDGRISLFELYVYSYNKVVDRHSDQHIVHHPYGDDYIILEQ